jgi:hypothetical protein
MTDQWVLDLVFQTRSCSQGRGQRQTKHPNRGGKAVFARDHALTPALIHVAYTNSGDDARPAPIPEFRCRQCLSLDPVFTSINTALQVDNTQYGDCKTPTEADLRRSNKYTTKHPLISSIRQKTKTRSALIASKQIQELAEWPKRKARLEPALSLRIRGAGEDDTGHGWVEEEQFRKGSAMGTTRTWRLQSADR